MATLIVGGTGFVGSRLATILHRHGERVACFDLFPHPPRSAWLDPAVPLVRGDVSQIEQILAAIKAHRITRIVNLAYLLSTESEADPQQAIRVNVLGMNNVFEAARLGGLERVVYASSIAYHGLQRSFGRRPVTEEDPGYPTLIYGATKQLNEFMAAKYAAKYDLSIAGIRISIAFGPGRTTGLTRWAGEFASNPALGKPGHIPFRSSQESSVIYVDDAAELFARVTLAATLQHGVYLSGGYTCTMADLANEVRAVIPDARITFNEEAPEQPYVFLVDGSRVRQEFGFELPPLSQRIRDHIAEARRAVAATGAGAA